MNYLLKHIQKIRLSVRLFILAALCIMPFFTWYLSHLPMGDVKAIIDEDYANVQHYIIHMMDGVAHSGFLSDDALEGTSQENQNISDTIAVASGDVWSARLFGIEWLDMLAWAELTVLSKSMVLPLLAGGLSVLLLTICCGRIFCSWICPAGLLFDLCDKIRVKIEASGRRLRDIKFKRWHKYVLLTVGLFIGLIVGLPLLGYFYPPALFLRELHAVVYAFMDNATEEAWFGVTLALSGVSLFLFALLMFETFVSKRFWCRYMCAGGALYSLFGRFRLFRIQRVKAQCTDCGDCNKACPMGLHPMTDALGIECDNCFACHSVCPEEALPIKITQHDVQCESCAA